MWSLSFAPLHSFQTSFGRGYECRPSRGGVSRVSRRSRAEEGPCSEDGSGPFTVTPLSHSGLWGNRLRLTTPGLGQWARLGPGAFPGLAPQSRASFSLGAGTTRGRSQGCLLACLRACRPEGEAGAESRREGRAVMPASHRTCPLRCLSLCLGPAFSCPGPQGCGWAGEMPGPAGACGPAPPGPRGDHTEDKLLRWLRQHILSLPEVGTSILLLNLPLPSHP